MISKYILYIRQAIQLKTNSTLKSTKFNFLILGVGFGLLFPMLGSVLVCAGEGCPDGVVYLHQHSIQMQIIDLAPIVLGVFSYLLGVSVDRRKQSDQIAYLAMQDKANLQKDLAQKLQLQNDALRELNATLDGFVYTASHDLKTPVINFESMLKMLRMVKDQPNSEGMVEEILGRMELATQRFHVTIADFLAISRMEQQSDEEQTPISIGEVIEGIQSDLSEFIRQNNATIQVQLQDAWVVGSSVSFTSVFQNLLTNAIKFRHPDRNPHISIRSKRVGETLELQLADNGIGIDLEKFGNKIFQMFSRLHSGVDGTGVGLYIVKRTITKLGGSIAIESQPGVGTTFLIQLPHYQPR